MSNTPNLWALDNRTILRSSHMRALDLVISVDSMPAHLAGALGVPVWTLLARPGGWRWLEEPEVAHGIQR
jgi:ADP-heptose:LPS heptosyltransferase